MGQPSFDAVHILIDLEDARELREGLLNTLIGTGVDPKDAPVSALCFVLGSGSELDLSTSHTCPADPARI